jgi:hypothetical protein
MNKYFKFPVESNFGTGIQYIEFDSDGWPIRQIECYGNKWFSSDKQKSGGIDLCDQPLTELSTELGDLIDSKEFDSAWKMSGKKTTSPNLRDKEAKISNV